MLEPQSPPLLQKQPKTLRRSLTPVWGLGYSPKRSLVVQQSVPALTADTYSLVSDVAREGDSAGTGSIVLIPYIWVIWFPHPFEILLDFLILYQERTDIYL